MTALRILIWLALIAWVGGIIFFAFVMAPTLFSLLSVNQAGNVVSRSLTALHWMGIMSAVTFLICSLLYSQMKYTRPRPFALVNVFVMVMLALTLISQFGITPRMRALRPQIESSVEARSEFDHLHGWSTRAEGGVLFLGLGVVILTARRFS
jgi:hypothetical protein